MFRHQRNESHRCALSRLEGVVTLNPEAGDAEQRFPLRHTVANVPHGPEESAWRYRRRTASVLDGQQTKFGQEGAGASLTAPPSAPSGIRLQPHQPSGIDQQTPELRRLRMSITEFLKKEKGHLPLVVSQVLQHISHADVELGPNVGTTETSRLQKGRILGIHGLIVPVQSIASAERSLT
ncbi:MULTISPECIES: hypothetical protein [unclassified Nonomuraea]|uniref:hypothetical protein n=1 Tax=unclassified Nonomuraea TaxID=2593643 RepID=UPI0033C0B680